MIEYTKVFLVNAWNHVCICGTIFVFRSRSGRTMWLTQYNSPEKIFFGTKTLFIINFFLSSFIFNKLLKLYCWIDPSAIGRAQPEHLTIVFIILPLDYFFLLYEWNENEKSIWLTFFHIQQKWFGMQLSINDRYASFLVHFY